MSHKETIKKYRRLMNTYAASRNKFDEYASTKLMVYAHNNGREIIELILDLHARLLRLESKHDK